jgi:hypothetical protein
VIAIKKTRKENELKSMWNCVIQNTGNLGATSASRSAENILFTRERPTGEPLKQYGKVLVILHRPNGITREAASAPSGSALRANCHCVQDPNETCLRRESKKTPAAISAAKRQHRKADGPFPQIAA